MTRYRISFVVETDEDPSTLLDMAHEHKDALCEETEGQGSDQDVAVEEIQ